MPSLTVATALFAAGLLAETPADAVSLAPDDYFRCEIDWIARTGGRRQLLIGREDGPRMTVDEEGVYWIDTDFYADFAADPDDEIARRFWRGNARSTHYFSVQRIARDQAACLGRSVNYVQEELVAGDDLVRARFRERDLGLVIEIEASAAACRYNAPMPYRSDCVVIRITPGAALLNREIPSVNLAETPG